MTTTMRMMTMALLLALAGCGPQKVSYDARASAEYHAAWQKKVAGDTEGYRAALQRVASRYPDSRAGVRARQELRPQGSGPGLLGFVAMLSQLASRGLVTPAPAMPTPTPTPAQ
jgi:hypothetical protein